MSKPISYTFAAIFTKEDDGRYSVHFPQLDGCLTEGKDFEEACRMASEAMSLHLFGMEQDGDPIPKAVFDFITKPSEMLVPITAWMTPFREEMENRSIKKTLTVPAWLNEAAERRGINYSQVLQNALKNYPGVYHP